MACSRGDLLFAILKASLGNFCDKLDCEAIMYISGMIFYELALMIFIGFNGNLDIRSWMRFYLPLMSFTSKE